MPHKHSVRVLIFAFKKDSNTCAVFSIEIYGRKTTGGSDSLVFLGWIILWNEQLDNTEGNTSSLWQWIEC